MIFLVPVGLIAVIWNLISNKARVVLFLRDVFLFIVLVLGISFILNPLLWRQPISASMDAIRLRTSLTQQQEHAIKTVSPDSLLNTPSKKISGLIANLFYSSPAIADVNNYVAHQMIETTSYLSNPFHTLFRSIIGGSILLILSLSGFVKGIIDFIRRKSRTICMFLLLSIFGVIELLIMTNLPFQRYVIILVPISVLWIGYAINGLISAIQDKVATKK